MVSYFPRPSFPVKGEEERNDAATTEREQLQKREEKMFRPRMMNQKRKKLQSGKPAEMVQDCVQNETRRSDGDTTPKIQAKGEEERNEGTRNS